MEKVESELKMEVIESFLKNDYNPKEFLDNLHDIIVNFIILAGRGVSAVDMKDVAGYTEFLSGLYDAVRMASK